MLYIILYCFEHALSSLNTATDQKNRHSLTAVAGRVATSESFTHSYIVLAIGGGETISSTVQCFCLAVEASAVVNLLDFEFVSSMYALSEGATFSGNRFAILEQIVT